MLLLYRVSIKKLMNTRTEITPAYGCYLMIYITSNQLLVNHFKMNYDDGNLKKIKKPY